MVDYNEQGHESDVLIKQYCLRQMEQNEQVRQALHQATAALQQAQQLLQEDLKFHQEMHETGNVERLKLTDGPQQQKETDTPPWLLGRQPELQ
jgi:hypothetical protein